MGFREEFDSVNDGGFRAQFEKHRKPEATINAASGKTARQEYEDAGGGILPSIGRGLVGVKSVFDVAALGLEKAITGETKDTAPILRDTLNTLNAGASDPIGGEIIDAWNRGSGMARLGNVFDAIKENPQGILNYSAEMLPGAIVGGGAGGVVAKKVGESIAGRIANETAKAVLPKALAGAGFNVGATAVGGLGQNTSSAYADTGSLDKAIQQGVTQTLVESAVAAPFGAVLPFGRGVSPTLGKVLAVEPADEMLQTFAGNAAIGKDTTGGELAASAILGIPTGVVDVVGATLAAKDKPIAKTQTAPEPAPDADTEATNQREYKAAEAALDALLPEEVEAAKTVAQATGQADGQQNTQSASPEQTEAKPLAGFREQFEAANQQPTVHQNTEAIASVLPEQDATESVPTPTSAGKVIEPAEMPIHSDFGNGNAVSDALKGALNTKPVTVDFAAKPKPDQNMIDRDMAMAKQSALSVGATPSGAERITVRNGTVYIGNYPAVNFESGQDITVPAFTDNTGVAKALRDGGAISRNQKIFGLPKKAKAKVAAQNSALYAEKARKNFLSEIKKAGGVTIKESRDITGATPLSASRMYPGLFTKNGRHPDLIARDLYYAGYLTEEEYNDVDGGVQRTRELIGQALAGEFVGTPAQHEYLAELEARETAENEALRYEEEQALLDEIFGETPTEAEFAALFDGQPVNEAQDHADAGYAKGVEDDAAEIAGIEGQVAGDVTGRAATGNGSRQGQSGRAAVQIPVQSGERGQGNTGRAEGIQGDDGGQQGQDFGLNRQTERDLADREAAIARREAEIARREAEAANKDKADRERNDFALTGSDRAADANPKQGDLLRTKSENVDSTSTSFLRSDEPRSGTPVLEHEAVEVIVKRIAVGLNLGVDTVVHRSEAALFDAVPEIGKQAKQENAEGEVNAVYFKGQVHVVSSKFASGADVETAILDAVAHEGQGHYGIRAMHGGDTDALRKALVGLFREMGGLDGVKRLADKHGVDMRLYFDTAKGMKPEARAAYLTDELLAHLQGKAATASLPTRIANAIKTYLGAVRGWLRAHGFENLAKGTDADIALLLQRMREAATREYGGKGLKARFVRKDGGEAMLPSFRETERAYGGQAAYDKAKVAGKTKLNYRQWVQVRTPEFKAWFGDWENRAILNGSPVANLKTSDAPSGGFKDVENWAAGIFAAQGGKAVRAGLGEIVLDHRAAQTSMAHGGANKYKKIAFAAVKDVIERGALIHQSGTAEEDSFFFSAPVDIDGTTNIETVLVHRDVNTKRMYLHSVTTKENLLNQRVSSADDLTPKRSGSIDSAGTSRLLQDAIKGNGVSKVTDPETGEPLVVYHGTAADFNAFDNKKTGANDRGLWGRGHYFSAVVRNANSYAERQGDGARVIPAFSSIKNPLVLRTGTDLVTRLPDGTNYRDFVGANLDGSKIKEIAESGGYDGVIQIKPDGFIGDLVAYTPSQIKSAIGNTGEFGADNDDIRFSRNNNSTNTTTKPSKRRDDFGRLQFETGVKIKEKALDFTRWAVGKSNVTQILYDSFRLAPPKLQIEIRKMKASQQKALDAAATIAKSTSGMTAPERALISDIVEKMVKPGVTPPQNIVAIADKISQIMDRQTDELVALGMLSGDAAQRWRGKYLPRFYQRRTDPALEDVTKRLFGSANPLRGLGGNSLKARGLFHTVHESDVPRYEAMGWEVRDPLWVHRNGKLEMEIKDPLFRNLDTVEMWRDYMPVERENMGEIRDAVFRFAMGYTSMQNDIALGKLFDAIAKNSEWTRPREEDGYKKIPDSEIPGTGGVKRYGNLAGLWVRGDIFEHVTQYEDSKEWLKLYRKGMGIWKMGKVPLNPVSHTNNIVSNLTMAHFAGVSYWDSHKYIGALRDFANQAPMLNEAKDIGLLTGDITRTEMMAEMPKEIRDMMDMRESKTMKGAKFAYDISTFFFRKKMLSAYRFEDDFFKYLIYRDARKHGMKPEDAMVYATQYIFNYDDLPRGARVVRDTAIPFFSYTYKAVPALLHTATHYPWRFAAPSVVVGGYGLAVYGVLAALAGGDDEDIERAFAQKQSDMENLPPWDQGKSVFLTDKTLRTGVTDDLTGLPVFMNIYRWLPGGDMLDTGHGDMTSLPAPITPNHPILGMIAAMLPQINRDIFTGKDVVDRNDTGEEVFKKRAGYMLKTLSPAIAPTGYHADKLLNALAYESDTTINVPFTDIEYTGTGKDGLPVQAKYAIPQTLGVKIKPVDLERNQEFKRLDDYGDVRSIVNEVRSAARLREKGAISQRAYEAIQDDAEQKIGRIRQNQ